jgi:hypothetical protein
LRELLKQWNTVTQHVIAPNPFSFFVVPAPGMGVTIIMATMEIKRKAAPGPKNAAKVRAVD